MIIACPSCATHHNLPDDNFAHDGSIIRCNACGHSWLEARAIEIVDVSHDNIPPNHDHFSGSTNLPALTLNSDHDPDTEYEAVRIAKAIKQFEQKQLKTKARRQAKIRSWMALAACICTPLALAATFPETVVRTLPGSIAVYDKLGIDVNIHGFAFANITHQYLMANGTRVLAIRGEIINVSGKEKIVPSMRFTLRDKSGKQVYAWSLNGVSQHPLRAGTATSFLTRVASPPKYAKDFQIRFAQTGEIAKTAFHENNENRPGKWSRN